MKNYEEMSDFEINKLVAIAVGVDVCLEQYEWYGDRDDNVVIINRNGKSDCVDYCNNPSDAWSIINDNQISITKYISVDEWDVFGGGVCVDYDHNIISESGCSHSNQNPLRAAMIVFLMMKDVGNDN